MCNPNSHSPMQPIAQTPRPRGKRLGAFLCLTVPMIAASTVAQAQNCESYLSIAPSFTPNGALWIDVGVPNFNNCGAPLPASLLIRIYRDAPSTAGGTLYWSYYSRCDNYVPVWRIGPIGIGNLRVVWVEAWVNPGNSGTEYRCPDWQPIAVRVGDHPNVDLDGDGVQNAYDNCRTHHNPDQQDTDADGLGDACDPRLLVSGGDSDADGITDQADNCPALSNSGQLDTDGDQVGDACDPAPDNPSGDGDSDGDGIADFRDNCPAVANADQADTDGDHAGNECDTDPLNPHWDADSDGLLNPQDNCPTVSNPDQSNTDGDTLGDACDDYPTVPGPVIEAISHSVSIVNRALAIPAVAVEAISRDASVVNRVLTALPVATEAISRDASLVNRALAQPPQTTEAISRDASMVNRALAPPPAAIEVISLACTAFNLTGDCNGNGVPDVDDVLLGTSPDANSNRIPDECEGQMGDMDCSGVVDTFDVPPFVLAMLDETAYRSLYPMCNILNADFTMNGRVDGDDVAGFVQSLP